MFIKTNKVQNKRYLIDNTIYKFSIKFSFSNQNKQGLKRMLFNKKDNTIYKFSIKLF